VIVGIPREIKNKEQRVAVVPSGLRELLWYGHKVIVERAAGEGSGISDNEYASEGAEIVENPEKVYGEAEMIVKVKEPLPQEYDLLREDHVLMAYLHLAANAGLTQTLLEKKVIAIAYDTVQLEDSSLPLLTPMSEAAGKLSVQIGAYYLQKDNGGSGVLLGGVVGINPGKVTIIGGGTVGSSAARIALGMGANVTILDVNVNRLRHLGEIFGGRLTTLVSNSRSIEEAVTNADLVVGAVLIPGGKAPTVVTRETISRMRQGSVVVDVAIDQGGCVETSHPTTFDNPVFMVDGVTHFCVPNIPAAVARTSTFALANATLPYVLSLANLGTEQALAASKPLARGLNSLRGKLTCKAVADSLDLEFTPYRIPGLARQALTP